MVIDSSKSASHKARRTVGDRHTWTSTWVMHIDDEMYAKSALHFSRNSTPRLSESPETQGEMGERNREPTCTIRDSSCSTDACSLGCTVALIICLFIMLYLCSALWCSWRTPFSWRSQRSWGEGESPWAVAMCQTTREMSAQHLKIQPKFSHQYGKLCINMQTRTVPWYTSTSAHHPNQSETARGLWKRP